MITKLLLTLGVILAAWLVLRSRQRRMREIAAQPRLAAPSSPAFNPWKWGGYLLLPVMILGSGLYLYAEWQSRYRVVTVSVVNTQTGERSEFRAHRGDVEGRRFVTLDGREISVAGTERIELGEAPAAAE